MTTMIISPYIASLRRGMAVRSVCDLSTIVVNHAYIQKTKQTKNVIYITKKKSVCTDYINNREIFSQHFLTCKSLIQIRERLLMHSTNYADKQLGSFNNRTHTDKIFT